MSAVGTREAVPAPASQRRRGLGRLGQGLQRRILRRCTPAGRLALTLVAVAGFLGADTELTLAYQLFTFTFAVVLLAIAGSTVFRARFEARRELPHYATAGEPINYRITVTNRGARPQTDLSLLEHIESEPPPIRARRGLRPYLADAWSRILGRETVATFQARRARVRIPDHALPDLPPDASGTVSITLVPPRRGALRFGNLAVARTDPLGLFRALRTVPAAATLLVLPRRYDLPELVLPGARRYQHGGVALATSVGDSEEFLGLRDYRPGDPLQRIHWKSFARIGVPIVREYQNEFFERHALVLDTYVADLAPDKLEEAVAVAASFACTVDTQESLLDLLFVGTDAYCYTAGRGELQTESLLEVLAHVAPARDRDMGLLLRSVLGRRDALAGAILVLLDWDRPRQELVDRLRETGLPLQVYVVVLADEALATAPWVHRLRIGHVAEDLATPATSEALSAAGAGSG